MYFGGLVVCRDNTESWENTDRKKKPKADLAPRNQLYQHQLLQCLHLNSSRHLPRAADAYLKKFLSLTPPFKGGKGNTTGIVVGKAVIVIEVTEVGVDRGYWVREHGKGSRELVRRHANLR